MRLMYGADELPLMLDQSVFSITMRNTVRMVDDGCVVEVVVVGGRVVDVDVVRVVVVGGRVVDVDVVEVVVIGGRVEVVVVDVVEVLVVGGRVVVVVEDEGGVTVRLKVLVAPPDPSTTMKYVG